MCICGFPFDLAQGGESLDCAQDRERVEAWISPREAVLVRNDEFDEL